MKGATNPGTGLRQTHQQNMDSVPRIRFEVARKGLPACMTYDVWQGLACSLSGTRPYAQDMQTSPTPVWASQVADISNGGQHEPSSVLTDQGII
jgi:hypothetical protein